MHNVQVTPIIGLPQIDGWSHVTQNQNNSLIWTVSLHGNHARNVGRDLLDFIATSEPAHSAQFFEVFQKSIALAEEKDALLSCATLFFEGDVVTFATYHAQILLKRAGKVGTLLDGLETTKVIQGKFQTDDVYILATAKAVTFLDEVKLKIKQGYDIDSVVTSLTPSLQLENNSSLAALAFVDTLPVKNDSENTNVTTHNSEFQDYNDEVENLVDDQNGAIGKKSDVFLSTNSVLRTDVPEDALLKEVVSEESKVSVDLSAVADSTLQRFSQIGGVVWSVFGVVSKKITSLGKMVHSQGMSSFQNNGPHFFDNVLQQAKRGTQKAQNIFRQLFRNEVYVHTSQSKKIARYILFGLIVILTLGTGIGWWQWQRSQKVAVVTQQLEPLREIFRAAQEKTQNSPFEARDLLISIQEDAQTLETAHQNFPAGLQKIASFLEKVELAYQEVSGREELQELPIFFNFSSIEPRFIGSDWAILDQTIWVLDGDAKQAIEFDTTTKQGTVYDITSKQDDSELTTERIRSVAITPNSGDPIFFGNSIMEFNPQTNTFTVLMDSRSEIEGARLLRTYGPNVYIFNSARQNIFRAVRNDDGLGTLRGWVRSSQGLQYDQVISMAIDGDIWLGDRTGSIVRMRTGNPETFTISGLENTFTSEIMLYTQEELENIYVLEPNQQRIVVLTKEGEFVKEVVSASLASVNSIVVLQDEQSVLALSGSLVYQIDL